MKKPICFILLPLIVMFLTVSVCFGEEQASASDKGKSAEADQGSYKIGSGDILEIITWKEPDFSREEVLVRIDGKITFPLLNDVQAAGQTTLELKKNMEEKLKDFVETPVITVTVRTPGSQKFYILGEVARTGEYDLIKNLTVLQAFALAGGFTEWASKNEIILLRRVGGEIKMISIKYKDIVKGKDLSQDIPIKANDTIIVP